jgi:polyhydroxybutyrate depolymerase
MQKHVLVSLGIVALGWSALACAPDSDSRIHDDTDADAVRTETGGGTSSGSIGGGAAETTDAGATGSTDAGATGTSDAGATGMRDSGGAGTDGGMPGASGDGGSGGMGGSRDAGGGMGGSADAGGSEGGGPPAPGCGNAAAPKGARNLTLQVNGKARTYVLFVPNGYDPKRSIPLIFAWHSSGADGAESRRYYKLEPVTGDGAIIVYPNGLKGAWDLAAEGVDMKFFDALLASISKDYCVDQARVFSTGYSFGGMMSNSLACNRGSKLRAFAPMAGAFFDGTKSCATPVPAWIAHASNESVVSFAAGQAARDIWLKANGCGTKSMPASPSPCVAYQCSKAPVIWCVHTDGHVWPNFASKGVWAFFSSL